MCRPSHRVPSLVGEPPRDHRGGLLGGQLVRLPGPEVDDVGIAAAARRLSQRRRDVVHLWIGGRGGVAVLAHEAVDDAARGLAGERAGDRGRRRRRERGAVDRGRCPASGQRRNAVPICAARARRPAPRRRRAPTRGRPPRPAGHARALRRAAAAPAARTAPRRRRRTSRGARPPRSPARRARRRPPSSASSLLGLVTVTHTDGAVRAQPRDDLGGRAAEDERHDGHRELAQRRELRVPVVVVEARLAECHARPVGLAPQALDVARVDAGLDADAGGVKTLTPNGRALRARKRTHLLAQIGSGAVARGQEAQATRFADTRPRGRPSPGRRPAAPGRSGCQGCRGSRCCPKMLAAAAVSGTVGSITWPAAVPGSHIAASATRGAALLSKRHQECMDRARRKPTSSIWKVGWLRRRTEARQLQCSSAHPPPRSTR